MPNNVYYCRNDFCVLRTIQDETFCHQHLMSCFFFCLGAFADHSLLGSLVGSLFYGWLKQETRNKTVWQNKQAQNMLVVTVATKGYATCCSKGMINHKSQASRKHNSQARSEKDRQATSLPVGLVSDVQVSLADILKASWWEYFRERVCGMYCFNSTPDKVALLPLLGLWMTLSAADLGASSLSKFCGPW